MEKIYIDHRELKFFVESLFVKLGVSVEKACIVADCLVCADLRGVESHGVKRLLRNYVERVELGLIDMDSDPEIVVDRGASLLIDGRNGFGQVSGVYAVKECLERSSKYGICLASIRRTNHMGMLAYYALQIVGENKLAIVLTNAAPSMPPWGGREALIGTNPICIGVPSRKFPIILDMATSQVSKGKIILAASRGEEIPLGWALSREGEPTTNPREALEGLLLPLGGYKGYGLALMVDILSGVLSGSGFNGGVGAVHDYSRESNVGALVIAVDISSLRSLEDFLSEIDEYISKIKSVKKAEGFGEILLPGEREYRVQEERLKRGIPFSTEEVKLLNNLAQRYGVGIALGL